VAPVSLKIPKTTRQVRLWVHPEGLVVGSLFVREQNLEQENPEEPQDVLNQESPFVVLLRQQPDELRFYNRNSIVRVMYPQSQGGSTAGMQVLPCQLTLMDGALLNGEIREALPPERARLFDYLNQDNCRFIKLYTDDGEICLVNKSYVNHVTTVTTN